MYVKVVYDLYREKQTSIHRKIVPHEFSKYINKKLKINFLSLYN